MKFPTAAIYHHDLQCVSSLTDTPLRTGRRSTERPTISRPSPPMDFSLSPETQLAASYIRYPGDALPRIPQEPDMLSEFSHLTLDGPYHFSAPDPPPSTPKTLRRKPQKLSRRLFARAASETTVPSLATTSQARPSEDSYTKAVNDWDRWNTENNAASNGGVVPRPLNVRGRSIDSLTDTSGSWISPGRPLSHKPHVDDLRSSMDLEIFLDDVPTGKRYGPRRSEDQTRIKRARIHQPLPTPPSPVSEMDPDWASFRGEKADSGVGSDFGTPTRKYLIRDSAKPIQLEDMVEHLGMLHMGNSEETVRHETMEPAVVHETIIENFHEIKQEVCACTDAIFMPFDMLTTKPQQIIREIHNHHIFHRILPVIDYEVLPARHFVPLPEGGYREISSSELPPGTGDRVEQVIADAVAQLLPPPPPPGAMHEPRRFTAREFPGAEGDYKEYMSPEGVLQTERWWVHPPTLEDGAYRTGQTEDFHFVHPAFRDQYREQGSSPAAHGDPMTGSFSSQQISPAMTRQQSDEGRYHATHSASQPAVLTIPV